jgi:hypothetical protein
MAYTVQIRPTDLGGPLPPPAAISGRLANHPGSTIETVTAVLANFGPDLRFTSAATPPAGSGTLHIGNNRNSGDLCRSGIIFSWPSSPATCEIVTIPPSQTTFSTARLGTMTRKVTGTTIPIPLWVTLLGSAVTGFMLAPTSITIGGMSITPSPPNLVLVTVVGTLAFRQFFFETATSFTANVALTIAPSGDVVDRSRIFFIDVLSSSLNPGVITPGMNLVLSILGPIVAKIASGEIEKFVNAEIDKEARKAVTQLDASASISPAAALCAHLVTVTPGTLAIEIVLSNPLGPALVRPIPDTSPAFSVSVTPTPIENASRTYTVHVTDAATGASIEGAAVEIATTSSNNARQSIRGTTLRGTAQLTATLRVGRVRVGGGTGSNEFIPPTLTVSKTGYATLVKDLLDR